MPLTPKRWQESATETVQVVLPNDSTPLGFSLGGTVMHLIDITGAIACHRHTNTLALTAAVDGLEFLGSRKDNQAISDIPVIVLTGQRGMTHKARQLDADVVLEKPVKLLMLVEAIHRVVDIRNRQRPTDA